MKTWVRKTLSVGVLAAGALLFAPAAAQADVSQDSSDNNGILNGTQVVAPIKVPLNVIGNAIGVAGEANAAGAGANWLTENGGVNQSSTDNNGILNGTQVYLPIDVPVNVVGNAVALLGEANAAGAGQNGSHTESARVETGGGAGQDSNDNNGVLNGTQLYAPIDVPINICGNGLSLLGEANAQAICGNGHGTPENGSASQNSSDNNGILNGTQAYAPIHIPLNIAGNAIGVAGEANAAAAATNESGSGASVNQDSNDNNGIGNGTQIAAPIKVPVNVCGNAIGILGEANAAAACTNGGSDDDDNGGNNGEYPETPGNDDDDDVDGNTGGGADDYRGGSARKAAKTEASAIEGVTQNLTNAGGLNLGGLDLLNTLR